MTSVNPFSESTQCLRIPQAVARALRSPSRVELFDLGLWEAAAPVPLPTWGRAGRAL